MCCYTDAVVHNNRNEASYGVLILDQNHKIFGAMAMADNTPLLPLAGEVQAIIQGLRLLQRLHIANVALFSNSLSAVQMINDVRCTTSKVHHWIVQIRKLCSELNTIGIFYTPRSKNMRADRLAKEALSKRLSMLWLSNFPLWLVSMGSETHCKCLSYCNCS